ncbi:MAG TPA: formate dehydrogenase accessory protein FdhE [Vicinamibacterales bacterium]|nr:formate dehydrogenase accessory protein FdhE [Vicinamibacterales bacterium]
MADQVPPNRPARAESRQTAELKALRHRHPELADAVDMHLELLELERRIQGRVPLPFLELSEAILARHAAEARPILRFEDIPLDLTDLRLMVRQTAEVLHRFGALDAEDFRQIQTLGRDMKLLTVAGGWYRSAAERQAASAAQQIPPSSGDEAYGGMVGQVLAQAMRPFLSRCAEVLQQRPELALWTHPHCALCGGEPDFAVITPAAERHLICSRCTLRWKFEPLTCPYCLNSDRTRITSFATPDGMYRVYACDVCRRYLKAYDGRRAARPVMPVVDGVATLPLDAAAIQRGYTS